MPKIKNYFTNKENYNMVKNRNSEIEFSEVNVKFENFMNKKLTNIM